MPITRSLVYKGMVYKGFFGPVLDFQKKLGFRILDLGDLRVLENMSAQANPQHFSLYMRQMNTQVITYIIS